MKLTSLLQTELILCRGEAADYSAARELLLDRLPALDAARRGLIREALDEREALASTVVAPGVAFPHARTGAVDDFAILIGAFPAGAAKVDGPVRLMVMFLVPEGQSNLYLRCLSALARFISRPGAVEQLVAAATPEALIDAIAASDPTIKDVVTVQDLMSHDLPPLRPEQTLREAATAMVRHSALSLPVADASGRYLGVLRGERLLRVGLPEYLFALDCLDFLTDFEPFEELLKHETDLKVGQLVEDDALVFCAETPMVQAAVKLVQSRACNAAVVDDAGRLQGTISVMDFVHKVVRA